MRINPTQNNNQINFKSVNLIQVSKKAFKSPDDVLDVYNTFQKALNSATNDFPTKIGAFFSLIGVGKYINKTANFFEKPNYLNILREAKMLGFNSLPSLKPISEDSHSFYVFTKEQKDALCDIFTLENLIKDAPSVVSSSKELISIRVNNYYTKKINEITKNEPLNMFEINDLSELPGLFKKIDY